MKILAVTPMLPSAHAVNAGPFVMYHQLAAVAARHDVTLATFAGPDPSEWKALDDLQALDIDVRAVWRLVPPRIMRRWRLLGAFTPMPDPSEWNATSDIRPQRPDVHPLRSTPIDRGKRRLQQLRDWVLRDYPLRTLQFWEPQMQQVLGELLAERTFDLIHVDDNAMGRYRYDTRAPRVLTEHEVRDDAEQPSRQEPSWVRRSVRKGEARRWEHYQPAIWRGFDRIQVFTPQDARAVRKLAAELAGRVRVNPFGIELPEEADPGREESDFVAFVGGFSHVPNVDAALWLGREVMPLLRVRHPGVRLAIVGSYPPKEVRALASDDILVTGRVPTVESYLERAAVVLAPVRTGGGMRLKVLQAMALGKAVVTTPLGAQGLAVENGGPPVVLRTEADEVADATANLLASKAERRALGRRARDFVARHHSWSAYGERLDAMYSELIDHDLLRSRSAPARHADHRPSGT
jgi:glycosyltransferase involved in cell wall biosynthesis